MAASIGRHGMCFLRAKHLRFSVALTSLWCRCRQQSSTASGHEPQTSTLSANGRWQLMSAVCLERLPVITREMSATEKDVAAMFSQMALDYSCLSDHELRLAEDMKVAEKRKQDEFEESEVDASAQTAIEAQDAWEEELNSFVPASRTTEADKENNVRSLDRKLDKKLVLVVKQKLGDKEHWVMPMGARHEGESMRMAAERVLSSLCGTNLLTVFLGNAPCGFYKYRYPSSLSNTNGYVGAKVFFFKAQLRAGKVAVDSDVTDYAWLGHAELSDYVLPAYQDHVDRFLIDL